NGLGKTVFLSGAVKGKVNDLNLQSFKLAYGHHTRFVGNLTLSGLPGIDTSYLHFDAKVLSTSYTDLASIPDYPFYENKKIDLPVELQRLGTISYKGKFDGFMKDFSLYGKFSTGIGDVSTRLSIRIGEKQEDISYNGTIQTINFALGALIGQNDLN